MVERIDAKLGRPERCPHGWPVDTELEKEENRDLAPLADLAPGSRATIVRLAEHDGDLLHWFYDQGLVPGAELELAAAQPQGQFTVRLASGETTMGEKAAQGLYVRAA
jgi:DtxR family Mn-dependent transcriptional regulator